jgi:hypothetical protein
MRLNGKFGILAGALALAACSGGKPAPALPDYGPEAGGKDDSATRPSVSVRIGYDSVVDFNLGDGGVNWRAWVFAGNKGQLVDAFAQGVDGTDTILYLYKVSRITGRPYGKPLAYNDDTADSGWSLRKGLGDFNPLSSSIHGAALPEDRDYALVVTTYQQAGGHALVEVVPRGAIYPSTIPPFAGANTPTPVVFADDSTHATVLATRQYPVSSTLQVVMRGSGLTISAAIYRADPSDVAAIFADGTYVGLAYGMLYGAPQANGYDASWTPINASDAIDSLLTAWGDNSDATRQLVTFVLSSMFKDAAFKAGDVNVYRIHWDNGDDTNAEGIAAVKTTTGEIRVLAIVNPA